MAWNSCGTENLDYYLGEHFAHWVGPTVSATDPDYSAKMAHLERVFQSANLIQECCNNWRDGLLGEPFAWHLKTASGDRADPEADAGASAAEQALQRWLDWVEQQALQADPAASNFQQASPWAEFALSLAVLGRANLRLWQPGRFAQDADPLHRIHLHAPRDGSVAVTRGNDGFIDKISYSYAQEQETQTQDEQGRILVTDAGGLPLEGIPPIDTGGRWLIQHSWMPSLLTPSVKALQNAINHALTMMLRNNELSGFREKVFANAEFPEGVSRGPGLDLYVYGVPTGDSTNPSYTNPSVFESEPVANSSLIESLNAWRSLLYREFSQGHLLTDSDAGLSGESRIQQRMAFELSLRGAAIRIESAIAAVLNIVLRILGYEGYEAVVELRISTGKLSAEEQKAVIDQYNAKLLATTSAMSRLGVKDPDAEVALIEAEMATAPTPQPDGILMNEPQPAPSPTDGQGNQPGAGNEPGAD